VTSCIWDRPVPGFCPPSHHKIGSRISPSNRLRHRVDIGKGFNGSTLLYLSFLHANPRRFISLIVVMLQSHCKGRRLGSISRLLVVCKPRDTISKQAAQGVTHWLNKTYPKVDIAVLSTKKDIQDQPTRSNGTRLISVEGNGPFHPGILYSLPGC
jgi:hypothetical protein